MAVAAAAEAAGTAAYRYHPHAAADVAACRSMAFSPYSSSASAASSFCPAPFSGVQQQQLDVLDYFSDDGGPPAVPGTFETQPLPPRAPTEAPVVPDVGYFTAHPRSAAAAVAAGTTDKIAFRTRSKEEVLDDGYKWRKYGKKSVKNSPNPRNYYRCSTEGCSVKKRVERDRDDANYVLTMYEGIHNHASPGTVYYAAQDAASGRFFVAGTYLSAP